MDVEGMRNQAKQRRDEALRLRSEGNDLLKRADGLETEAMTLEADAEKEAQRLLTDVQNQKDGASSGGFF